MIKLRVTTKKKSKNKDNSKRNKNILQFILDDAKCNPEFQNCKGFMREGLNNIALVNEDNTELIYHKISGKLSKRKLANCCNKFKNLKVLINCGKDVYKMISFATYKKLSKIKYILIDTEINILEDGADEPYRFSRKQSRISSMGQLFSFLNNRNGVNNLIHDIYEDGITGWFNEATVIETAIVLSKGNSIKEIKLSEFIEEYLKE